MVDSEMICEDRALEADGGRIEANEAGHENRSCVRIYSSSSIKLSFRTFLGPNWGIFGLE